MQIKLENYLLWIISIIFTAGMIYSNVIKIPAMASDIQILNTRQAVTEANYINIKESLDEIKSMLKSGGK